MNDQEPIELRLPWGGKVLRVDETFDRKVAECGVGIVLEGVRQLPDFDAGVFAETPLTPFIDACKLYAAATLGVLASQTKNPPDLIAHHALQVGQAVEDICREHAGLTGCEIESDGDKGDEWNHADGSKMQLKEFVAQTSAQVLSDVVNSTKSPTGVTALAYASYFAGVKTAFCDPSPDILAQVADLIVPELERRWLGSGGKRADRN
jgi:hypothetical protein